MRFEDLTPEQIEKAKKCETREERMAFIKENGIELTDEQLESVAGGRFELPWELACQENPNGKDHVWVRTGRTKPGDIFGDLWRSKEEQCQYCRETRWVW